MKRIFTFLVSICALLIMGCQSDGFSVSGTLENAPSLTVYFDEVNPMSRMNSVIAKGETNDNGVFQLDMEAAPDPGIYRIRAGAKSAYLLLDGSESKINIVGNLNNLSTFGYAVVGSKQSDAFAQKMQDYFSGKVKIAEMTEFVKSDSDGMLAMLIGLQLLSRSAEYAEVHQVISQKLNDQYPDQQFTSDYQTFADAMQKEYLRQQSMSKVRIGEIAPDIELPDPSGKIKKLSDLRGNIVLLDFWASWCRPCRIENPNVVRVYDKYKDQGFTVYSVSLDGLRSQQLKRTPKDQLDRQLRSQRDRWVAAIEQDNLKWDSHVSDLKHFDSQGAAIYGVRAIPQTYLIDREGKIAAINPRRNLEEAVVSALSKA